MKKIPVPVYLLLAGFIILTLHSCRKEQSVLIPEVDTSPLENLTSISTDAGGSVLSDGGSPVSARGVCWAMTIHPTILEDHTSDGSGKGKFSSIVNGLTSGINYYIRAYATNSVGTAYGQEVIFRLPLSDIDGNLYTTTIIGNQVWMAANLSSTRYNDGTPIPKIEDNAAWSALSTPAYCWYRNDESAYKKTYGALYNWFAVNTGKLCPAGWHVPSESEWTYLTVNVGGEDIASAELKEEGIIHWRYPNAGAINNFEFSALPGGYRNGLNPGSFRSLSYIGWWWSSTETDATWSRNRTMAYDATEIAKGWAIKRNGYSVRCVKD
jgi:uncharacterized protein (TIGR02145 family)